MGTGYSKVREINLGADFGDVVVRANSALVEIHTDGSILAYTNGTVITKPGPSNDSQGNESPAKAKTAPAVGDEMEDGTIYAGISPDTGKPMYATPADAPGIYDFNEAAKYAKNHEVHGHKDFRVPSKNELNVLYQNRDEGKLKGTFNETGSLPAGWYWSSSQLGFNRAWGQRFSDGNQISNYRGTYSSLRCVR